MYISQNHSESYFLDETRNRRMKNPMTGLAVMIGRSRIARKRLKQPQLPRRLPRMPEQSLTKPSLPRLAFEGKGFGVF